ncbi:uncharacterized protein LOC114966429 [Acropora millepora]|uniref:uncharacterized protein LOC114966429 n=1 Tax=Acropora millepora TaxID=45264 RepID=UPI001CF23B20|nr:uncharacterized protein LOC114966429 [Acropora millepora]
MDALWNNIAGFFWKKGRHRAAEMLKDGDVTNQKLRSVIVYEIDNLNSKIDALAQGNLKTSVSFFKEGLVFLKEALNTDISETDRRAEGREAKTPQTFPGVITTVVDNLPVLVKKLREQNLADLNESCKKALLDAEKKFDSANGKAAKVFHNDTLTPSDRIVAMALRLMATILAKIKNPASVLEVCRSNLEELHSAAIVQENFKTEFRKSPKVKRKMNKGERRGIISLVCHINRIIFDITLLIGERKELFRLPCIDIGNERVDPLRDARVAQMLRKVDMSDLSVIRSFGEEKKKKKVSSIFGIAENTSKQFLIARRGKIDFWVEVFDSSGGLLAKFGLPFTENRSRMVAAVATDEGDNIYVLTKCIGVYMTTEICVLDKTNLSERKVFDEFKFDASKFMVKDSHLLVTGKFDIGPASLTWDELQKDEFVLMYNTDGERLGDFSEKGNGILLDITADGNGNVMVLNKSSYVYVFALITTNNGDDDPGQDKASNSNLAHFLKKFEVAPSASAIAFHWPTGNLVIASDSGRCSSVLLYSMEGKLERSIDIKLEDTDRIRAARVSSDGSICVATDSKVLVL